jgi:hypothetical protein
LQLLLIEQACRELVLRAAALADAAQPAALAALFTEGGSLVRPGAEPLVGRAAIERSYAQRAPERITRHLVTNTLVEVVSDVQACATSTVLLWSGSTDDAAGPQGRPANPRQVVGAFADRFALTPEGWRIERRDASFVLHSGA